MSERTAPTLMPVDSRQRIHRFVNARSHAASMPSKRSWPSLLG
jgi:hypothetical protein